MYSDQFCVLFCIFISLFTRPIPLSTFKCCKDHFSFLKTCENCEQIVKKGKKVVLTYSGEMDPIS